MNHTHLSIRRAGLAEERAPALCRSRPRRRVEKNPARGFSMIELVIAISIIGAVALIAIPRLNETRARHRDENTARVIHRATEFAIAEARRRTATVVVTFNADDELLNIYAIFSDATNAEIQWGGRIAGQQRSGENTVAWLISADPHGNTEIVGTPLKASLVASLEATATAGTGIKKAMP